MPAQSKVYIAGVGSSPSPAANPSAEAAVASLVSAATKALLDAGVTFDSVSCGVKTKSSKHTSQAFKAFDEQEITVNEVESGAELGSAFRSVKDRGAQCVLTLVAEKDATVAFVLISETILWSHPYLKDSSVLIREADSQSKSKGQAKTGLSDVCHMVWRLRGWSKDAAGKEERLHYQGSSGQSFELSRADGNSIPDWKEVEHKQDGKHRLRHNPASETKDTSQEDFEAVIAEGTNDKESKNRLHFKHSGGDRAALARL